MEKRIPNDAKFSKDKADDKKKVLTENTVAADVLNQMVFSPTGSKKEGGITAPEKTAEIEKEASEKADLLIKLNDGKIKERLGKYKEQLIDSAKKDPSKFEVETERGWMNLAEAIRQGWNPKTGKFDLDPIKGVDKEAELSKLSPEERAAVEAEMRRPERREPEEQEGKPEEKTEVPLGQAPQGAPAPEGVPNTEPGAPNMGGAQMTPEMLAMMGGAR